MASSASLIDDDDGQGPAKKTKDSTDEDVDMSKNVTYPDKPMYSETSYKLRISCHLVKSGQWNPWNAAKRVLETIATQDGSLRVFPNNAKQAGEEGKTHTSLKQSKEIGEKYCTYEPNVWIPRVGKRNDVYITISTTLPWSTIAQRLYPGWRTQKMHVQQHHWTTMGEGKVAWIFGASNKLHWRPDLKIRFDEIFKQVTQTPDIPIPVYRIAAGKPASGYGDQALDCEAPMLYCDKKNITELVLLCRLATEKDLAKLILDDPKQSGLTSMEYRQIISDQNDLVNKACSISMWGFNKAARQSLLGTDICTSGVKALDGTQLFLSVENTPNTDKGGKLNFLTIPEHEDESREWLKANLIDGLENPDKAWVKGLLRTDCTELRFAHQTHTQSHKASPHSDSSYAKSLRKAHQSSDSVSEWTKNSQKKKNRRSSFQVVNYDAAYPALSTSRPSSPTASERSGSAWSGNSTIQTQITEITQQVSEMNKRWAESQANQAAAFAIQQKQLVSRIEEQQQMLQQQTANVANMMQMITDLLQRPMAQTGHPQMQSTPTAPEPAAPQPIPNSQPTVVTQPSPMETGPPPQMVPHTPPHQYAVPPNGYNHQYSPMTHPYNGYTPMDYTPAPSYWPAMDGVYQGNPPPMSYASQPRGTARP
jgi:hypothetical protein